MIDEIFPRTGRSSLLIVDVQERLMQAMPAGVPAVLLKSHVALIEMANSFELPIAYTEQYPKGLGPTVAGLSDLLGDHPSIEKSEFSACQNREFRERLLENLGDDVILTGVETHVCVLQTALDLLAEGRRVFVPLDAVASRTEENRRNGLALMERAGALITNSETLIFEKLGKASGDAFKRLSKLIR